MSKTKMDTTLTLVPETEPRPNVLVVRLGRGRTGGSTALDWIIQRARSQGRDVLIGDGDSRNPTLAGYYPPGGKGGANQPASDETADVKDWITARLSESAMRGLSLVLDLGGGDRVLAEYGRDLALVDFCESAGIIPLALYFSGPEMDDFEHIHTIHETGYFRPQRAILVFNENLVPQGRTTMGAFEPILARPELTKMVGDGMEIVFMPRLPCMMEMRRAGLSFFDAAANKPGADGKPLDPVRQFMIKSWNDRLEAAFAKAGASSWLP